MVKKRYQNIIFDLDGTLVDSAPDIIKCLKQSFANILQINDIKIDRNIIGPPVPDMIKIIKKDLSNDQVEVLTKAFRVCYDNCAFFGTHLYRGVAKLLQELKDQECAIFIVTNKPALPTKKILKKIRIDFFDKVITADIIKGKKLTKSEMVKFLIGSSDLDAGKSLMIGDTPGDIVAAKENGLVSIAVLEGYGSSAEICSAKPKFIVKNIEELSTIINQLQGEK